LLELNKSILYVNSIWKQARHMGIVAQQLHMDNSLL
jgi:hypothetical protein